MVQDLADLKKTDEGLWNKIKEFFSDILGKLKKALGAYDGLDPDSVEGRYVAEMKDSIRELEQLFTEGLTEAGENFRAISVKEQQKQVKVDKKQNYEFPQEVYDRLDKEFREEDVLYSERKKKVDEAVDKAIKQKGDLGVKYNQERISEFPADITAVVSAASDGRIDLNGKYIAISGDDVWHEYRRHSDASKEIGRR